jgi:hypothetical protein
MQRSWVCNGLDAYEEQKNKQKEASVAEQMMRTADEVREVSRSKMMQGFRGPILYFK